MPRFRSLLSIRTAVCTAALLPCASLAMAEDAASTQEQNMAEQSAEAFASFVDSWFFPGWDKSVAAGFNGSDGNSENLSFNAAITTSYEDESDRWNVGIFYFSNSSDGVTDKNQLTASVLKDWLLPDSDFFYWAQAEGKFDEETDYKTRLLLSAGAGYEVVNNDRHRLLLRAGVAGQYEFGDVDDFTPELVLGLEWRWAISDAQTFRFSNTLYPSLDPAFEEFRNITSATYEILLAAGEGLSLRLGVLNEYTSDVEPNFDENDLTYFGALAFDF